ncbi:hypothetical protein M407DRAFT_245195 [Tulasnella calospora MUT 4182]|uniref:Rhamnose mutarotase n=1 Tax=Tulasnella calospora MUT 4182 TaxID=1051891 RepID=A0A0C3LM47_9AGAM|nr:hypothetical protein M407DRAFT_245195 [Tulasnella calospora MUT 4182]
MKRFCQVIELRKQYKEEYLKLHSNVWPSVLAGLKEAHIEDYSISFLPVPVYPSADPEIAGLLIASFKYSGSDLEGDMKNLAADPETQRWWKLTDPMQKSLVKGATGSADGEWWLNIDEVFRLD